jgi:hypothetical protein
MAFTHTKKVEIGAFRKARIRSQTSGSDQKGPEHCSLQLLFSGTGNYFFFQIWELLLAFGRIRFSSEDRSGQYGSDLPTLVPVFNSATNLPVTHLLFLVAECFACLVAEELLDTLGMPLGATFAWVWLAAVATAVRIHFSVLVNLLQN